MARGYDVVGIGCCAFDIVAEADRFPGADEKGPVRSIRIQGGGLTATAMVAVARLGGRCAYVGPLGDDFFAQYCVEDFDREGVDTQFIRRVAGKSVVTALIVACPPTGTRMILSTAAENPDSTADDVPEDVVRSAGVLHVDNYQPEAVLRGAEIARDAGVPITMDLEMHGDDPGRYLPVGDHVIAPMALAHRRYGTHSAKDCAEALYDEIAPTGGRVAVVTAGTQGAHAVWSGGAMHQPAFRADVVDTTGCGDVFHGAYALALARGWPVERVLPFAAAVAALKCRKLGGRAGIPTQAEADEFLAGAEPIT